MSIRSKKARRWRRKLARYKAVRDRGLEARKEEIRRTAAHHYASIQHAELELEQHIQQAIDALIVHTPEATYFRVKRNAKKFGRSGRNPSR